MYGVALIATACRIFVLFATHRGNVGGRSRLWSSNEILTPKKWRWSLLSGAGVAVELSRVLREVIL